MHFILKEACLYNGIVQSALRAIGRQTVMTSQDIVCIIYIIYKIYLL